MLYKYNKHELKFEPVVKLKYFRWVVVVLMLMSFVSINTMEVKDYERILKININGEREFNENRLVKELSKYKNIKYPHIVLAQAKLESNNYSSRIFIENNNLFGMKEANVRITTAEGTQYKHARYETWQESVLDYILWQNRYGSKCKTEQQYYSLLNGYAEDPDYQAKLKNVIKKNNLKELFN